VYKSTFSLDHGPCIRCGVDVAPRDEDVKNLISCYPTVLLLHFSEMFGDSV